MPYDYMSVMHLGMRAFAKGKSKTIVPVQAIDSFASGTYPTTYDIFHINVVYCEGTCNAYN